jgi:hypothetical protein
MKIKKQNKLFFYLKGYSNVLFCIPRDFKVKILELESQLSEEQLTKTKQRIDYYCKASLKSSYGNTTIKDLKNPKTPKSYYFDTYEYARFFDGNLPINFVFGDVTEVPKVPSIVKSRPIFKDNQNSVLLNLDKARHFVWVKDHIPFLSKKNILYGRAAVHQEHRKVFYEKYFHHPLCDLGQINKNGGNQQWIKPKSSLKEHLGYKFILSLQGNDVATNLKWIMSSNSIAVMPRPTMETWFMEGKLQGGKHFIEIKPDYSDLEEQLNFYIANPEKCLEIINNANHYCAQFFDKNLEGYCSLKVLEKYFNLQ